MLPMSLVFSSRVPNSRVMKFFVANHLDQLGNLGSRRCDELASLQCLFALIAK